MSCIATFKVAIPLRKILGKKDTSKLRKKGSRNENGAGFERIFRK